MKCPICGGDTLNDLVVKGKMTNEEWFCNLPTEEKAKFLFDIGEYDWLENIAEEHHKSLHEVQEVCDGIVEWLKRPHRNE